MFYLFNGMLKAAQLALKPFVLLEKVVDSGQHLLVLVPHVNVLLLVANN